ncbi:hypothetical protein [Loigolactobacillus iwatensis]|uniref:hypothetical protein n=1 Tax=Loigolactobacillus iwatensis TaxID=1267156 RepID=UPI000F7EC504|nr:hypothetical protein [Loigolactobacillus iwatensis]
MTKLLERLLLGLKQTGQKLNQAQGKQTAAFSAAIFHGKKFNYVSSLELAALLVTDHNTITNALHQISPNLDMPLRSTANGLDVQLFD